MRLHTGDKPYSCNQCDFKAVSSSHLTIHLRKHTGELPYSCPHCPKKFAQSANLTSHMRFNHMLKCNQCDYLTSNLDDLTNHFRNHNV